MGAQPILQMHNVSKSFFGFYALKNIDLTIYPGEVHSLLGENGAGKSTLIKILAGINSIDEGSLSMNGQPLVIKSARHAHELGITVVFQELNLVSSLSVAENIFFGRLPVKGFGKVDWKKLYQDSKALLEEVGLHIDPRTKVGYLGVAQQQLIEIARALSHESKIICMDEPTSALSNKEIELLFQLIEKLKKKNVAIIYVSHKFEELFRITDRITVLRDGEKIDEVMTKKTTKDELISMMVGRKLNNLYPKMKVTPGETLLKVKNLTSDRIKGASFEVKAGQIVGFSGLMGSGRTELAKALFGIDKTYSGEIWIGNKQVPRNSPTESKKMGLGYIPENRKEDGLVLTAGVRENMTLAILKNLMKHGVLQKNKEIVKVRENIDKLKVKTQSTEQKIVLLSGGNQQKVVLLRWLLNPDLKVLILDEPTRGIDVGSKSEIYALISQLAASGLAILLMSSEMPELLSMSDRIYVMKDGEIVGDYAIEEASQERLIDTAIGGKKHGA